METLPSFWPSKDDQAVMAAWFAEYHDFAYGMCYLFGAKREAGLTTEDAAIQVRLSMESQLGGAVC